MHSEFVDVGVFVCACVLGAFVDAVYMCVDCLHVDSLCMRLISLICVLLIFRVPA